MRTETLGGLTVRITGGADGDGGGDGPLVVLMHGFGAPGDDLVPLRRAIAVPTNTRWAFPAAPLSLEAQFGGGARAWWMIDMARLQMAMMTGRARDLTRDVPRELPDVRAKAAAMLTELQRVLGARPEQTYIGGFSQGAMLATDLALRTDAPLAGLVVLSGTLLAEHEWLPLMPARAGLRVFQSHGRNDELLPFAIAEELRTKFNAAGLPVKWVPFAGGHEIPQAVLTSLGEFLFARG